MSGCCRGLPAQVCLARVNGCDDEPDLFAGRRMENRTWPWRREDDGDLAAEQERKVRTEPFSTIVDGKKRYFA